MIQIISLSDNDHSFVRNKIEILDKKNEIKCLKNQLNHKEEATEYSGSF